VCATLKLWGSEAKFPENALAADVESGQLSPSLVHVPWEAKAKVPIMTQKVLATKSE